MFQHLGILTPEKKSKCCWFEVENMTINRVIIVTVLMKGRSKNEVR